MSDTLSSSKLAGGSLMTARMPPDTLRRIGLRDLAAPPAPATFVLYARKSTEGEDRQIQSIDDQTRHCQAIADAEGLDVPFRTAEARSAKRHGTRPGFREMIERIEAGEADGILAWHPDRLARNAIDGGWILDLLDRGKLRHLRFAAYTFENTPEGKMMLGMIFSQAKYQVDKLAVDVRRGMDTKREQGWFPHRVGEGYRNDLETRTVVADPVRFPLLRRAVELILDGSYRPSEALKRLNDDWGYRTKPTKKGGGPLSRSGFYHVLSNPFYYGECREGGISYPGAHPPLMTQGEFRRLQGRLSGGGSPKPQIHEHAFTGLLRCGRCDSAVTASRAKGHVYYHCTDRLRICSKAGVREEALEAQLLERFDGLSVAPWLEPLLFEVACRHLAETPDRDAEAEAGRGAALEAARKQLRGLTAMRLRELLTDGEYMEEKARLQGEIDGLERLSEGAGKETARRVETAAAVLSYAAWSKHAFQDAGPSGRRRLARKLGASLTLTGRELSVELNPCLALLTGRHADLLALGAEPPGTEPGDGGGPPIKPRETGSRSGRKPHRAGVVSGGPEWVVQTVKIGSGSTKTASFGETVSAGSPSGTTFKLLEQVGAELALLIREGDERFGEGLYGLLHGIQETQQSQGF
jgi:DNA invertase Pin-like site-specific DNA recombinase